MIVTGQHWRDIPEPVRFIYISMRMPNGKQEYVLIPNYYWNMEMEVVLYVVTRDHYVEAASTIEHAIKIARTVRGDLYRGYWSRLIGEIKLIPINLEEIFEHLI